MVSSANARPPAFRIKATLPGGGMALVWRAVTADATEVALKRLRPEFRDDPDLRLMFADEGRLGARLGHPHIVRLVEHGEDEDGPFLAFEFVDGADLREVLSSRGQPLPRKVVHVLARTLLSALDYAHGQTDASGQPLGVVHRDVSPSNVLLSRTGEVKLADFGVAASGIKTHRTRVGDLKGRCAYMSPEQTRGDPLDGRSDLFSLGIVLWEAATCRPLFDRPTDVDTMLAVREATIPSLDAQRADLPKPLRSLIHRLLLPEVGQRPASAGAALMELDAAVAPPTEEDALGQVQALVAQHAPVREEVPPRDQTPRRRRTALLNRPSSPGTPAASVPVPQAESGIPPVREAAAPSPTGRTWVVPAGMVVALLVAWGGWRWWEQGSPPAVAPVVHPAPPDELMSRFPDPQPTSVPAAGPSSAVALPVQPPRTHGIKHLPRAVPARPGRTETVSSSSSGTQSVKTAPTPILPAAEPPPPVPSASTLPLAYGTLDFNSDPWAEISVDGVPLGLTTPARNVRVPSGTRRITFRNPVFKLEKTIPVEVPPNARKAVVVDLDH